jgi:hypothetical protein
MAQKQKGVADAMIEADKPLLICALMKDRMPLAHTTCPSLQPTTEPRLTEGRLALTTQ